MAIVKRIEELLNSYNVDYEKEYFEEDKTTEFRFIIGKRGMIVAYDKTTNEENDVDGFMGGFDNEIGITSDYPIFHSIEDALLEMALMIKQKIKKYHYKGIQ